MKVITFCLMFFCLNTVFSQDFHKDSLINDYIKTLRLRKIKRILIYEKGVVGADYFTMVYNDTCRYLENKKFYIFGEKMAKTT